MIVVTTPTGHIGSALAERLLHRGEPLRLIARDPSKLSPALRDGAETIAGSHSDAAVLDAVLAGADGLFLVVPPDRAAATVEGHYLEYARAARAAIERQGVGHAVLISTMGDGEEPAGQLSAARAAEAEMGASGAAVRAIAPPFFLENLLHQAGGIRDGVIALPSRADMVLPVVATDDLAALAADLLTDRSWQGVDRIPVSSPDSLTPIELATTIGRTLGREVTYRETPVAEYDRMVRSLGLSPAWAEGFIQMAIAQNSGFYDAESDAARGRCPTTAAAWAERVLRPAVEA